MLSAKQFSVGVFIDRKKAFDLIDHEILIYKLPKYGLWGTVSNWLQSYVYNGRQYFCVDSVESSPLKIRSGVAQGSILGPLLFILFVNDIFLVSNICTTILFADDTNIFLSGNDPIRLFSDMNHQLEIYFNWFSDNKLVLNFKKSCYIIFGPKIKTNENLFNNLNISIGDTTLPRNNFTKFLGPIMQGDLKWDEHVNALLSKMYKVTGIIYKSRCKLNEDIMLMLYYSLFYPYLIYGNIFWGSSYKYLSNKLSISQKRFLRMCLFMKRSDHTAPIYIKHKILNIEQLNIF